MEDDVWRICPEAGLPLLRRRCPVSVVQPFPGGGVAQPVSKLQQCKGNGSQLGSPGPPSSRLGRVKV